MLVIEDPETGEWEGRSMVAGAGTELKGHKLQIVTWTHALERQKEIVAKEVTFHKPLKLKGRDHAATCGCTDCKRRNEINKLIKKDESNGDN